MTEIITAPDLAILQPYCTLLALDVKDVENKPVRTDYRGLVFLHSGKSLRLLEEINPAETTPEGLPCKWKPWTNPISMKGRMAAKVERDSRLLNRIRECWGSGRGGGYPAGCIIGVAELYGCIENSISLWAQPGQKHWLFRNARPIVPIPHRGHQGFWPNKPITKEVELL